MSWLSDLFGGKKSSSPDNPVQEPERYSSPYEAGAAKTLNDVLTARATGKNVGFAPEDLTQMYGQAQDTSTRNMNELLRRGLAARRLTGPEGITRGGGARLQEKALMTGLETRSKAMRDVGIQNAVLKRSEQQAALGGLQGFLSGERSAEQGTTAQSMAAQAANYNAATQNYLDQQSQNQAIMEMIGNIGRALAASRYF